LNAIQNSNLDIIQKRAEEAIKPGAIDEKVLEYVSEVTSSFPINGDIDMQ
jgi:hypothetical protein